MSGKKQWRSGFGLDMGKSKSEGRPSGKNISYTLITIMGLVFCLVLFLVTRLMLFGAVPAGFHIDEIGASYDAQCIAHYGVDRYLVRFPVYFKNFGAGQNALYTYLGALLFKFTSFSPKKFRLIAVCCGLLGMLSVYFISRLTFKEREFSITAPFLWCVFPVILMSERWGLESYLFLSFSAMSVCIILYAAYFRKALIWIIAGVFFGLTLYTYGVSYVVIPAFLLFILLYLIWIKKVTLREALCFSIPFILLAIPLFLEQLVTAELIPEFSLLFTDFTKMEYSRAGEFGLKYFMRNLKDLRTFFCADFLPYNGSARYGTMLYVSLPFAAVGMVICLYRTVKALVSKKLDGAVFIADFFIVSFLASLFMFQMNINRVNEVYLPLLMFTAFGINGLWKKIKITPVIILAAYAVFFIPFCRYYYTGPYNADIAADESGVLFNNTDLGAAVKTLSEHYDGEKVVCVITNDSHERHILIADYCGTSPYEFASEYSTAGNYRLGLDGDLDVSGDTVYVIDDNNAHIVTYLASLGFGVDSESFPGYNMVLAP